MPIANYIKILRQWLYNRFKINTQPVVKVYHGFGDDNTVRIFGHVFARSPFPQQKFRRRFTYNALSILRLFMVKPWPQVDVKVAWNGVQHKVTTADDGFFSFDFPSNLSLKEGWHDVTVILDNEGWENIAGHGKIFIPGNSCIGLISDIDDTFLVSHSANLRKRLYVLLTKNARSRRPFENVVQHYQLLATGGEDNLARPFFYVSSSEWNLYDYIREFSKHYKIPEGVYLLNQVKQINEFMKTGQNKHSGKYTRIVRLLKAYPEKQFVLLGDDSQEDPNIYYKLVKDFPGRIHCVYLRHVRDDRYPIISKLKQTMQEEGSEVCYFKHTSEAISHSRKIGLIK